MSVKSTLSCSYETILIVVLFESFCFFDLISEYFLRIKSKNRNAEPGLPWWLSDKESSCQCRRRRV